MITKWHLNSADVIYIGDNVAKDYQTPQQLDMNWLLFDNKGGIYQAKHDATISRVVSIEEVNKFLNSEV